jgi:hypothetical protein
MIQRIVERYEHGAPPTSLAHETLCGAPDAVGFNSPARGTPGSMWIQWPAKNPVWRFLVRRPAASSGTRGSGVEILYADYNGKRVLYRGHVPILNVLYDGDACGPYRDWQWEEHVFTANGIDVAPGFRWCTTRPQTIIDSGSDAGNFCGVAIYDSGDALTLVSEMQAGWYRYISEWTFNQAGWILPRFKFAATSSSCVCKVHHHHCYWRFDFDIEGAGGDVVDEWNQNVGWRQLKNEIKRYRNQASSRQWRIRNATTGTSYLIVPGTNDGTALGDEYARGDAWFVRYRGEAEHDDGYDQTSGPGTPANIDKFVNGESMDREDVVVWYAGHFRHSVSENHAGDDHTVGPTIMGPCVVQAAGSGLLSGEDFGVLRSFRDRMLKRAPAGGQYISKFEEHSDELLQLFLKDERLRKEAGTLAKVLVRVVQEATQKKPPILQDEFIEQGFALMRLLDTNGSVGLKATLASARADLAAFRGASLREGLAGMRGPVA